MKFKTIEELKAYFNTLDKENEWQVGPMHSSHSRSVWQIGNAQIIIDYVMPHNIFKPSREWSWTNYSMTTPQAEAYAEKYNATMEEDYYPEEGVDSMQLIFDETDDLLQWLFDNKLDDLNQ